VGVAHDFMLFGHDCVLSALAVRYGSKSGFNIKLTYDTARD